MTAFADHLTADCHRTLYAHWLGLKGARTLPPRAALDPVAIPGVLPHIGLIDVIDGGRRYYYRLVGTRIAETVGADFSRTYLDDSRDEQHRAFLGGLYGEVVAKRAPLYSESHATYTGKGHLWTKRLLLPFAHGDGRNVAVILFCNDYVSHIMDTDRSPVCTVDIEEITETVRAATS